MTLYGTPETAQKMMDNMAKGFGIRAMAEGFLGGASSPADSGGSSNGHSPSGASQVDTLLGNLGRLVTPAIEKLTGQSGTTTEQADAIANALASNPAALQAIADALAGDIKTVGVTPAVPSAAVSNGAVAYPLAAVEKK